jgi:predicted small metal-binding protein
MVHGTNYGLQYIFMADRDIDYYDDILKISIDIRKKLFEKNSKSFIIFNTTEFDKRLYNLDHGKKYINALNNIEYNMSVSRETNPEYFLYYDVVVYNKEKHNYLTILSLEKINKLKLELELLNHENNNYYDQNTYKTIQKLKNKIDIQNIISNEEYYKKVKQIENELIDIKLTDEEKEIIKKIVNHKLFHFDVTWHGFEFMNEKY